ncbi:MAG: 2-C-methyl-D-erythritol 4-phosphate cytidylyltransferase, partial [Verrucomicrobiota bacterium]
RMGSDKLFATLCGKPVIAHSIAAFDRSRDIRDIILVTREDRIGEMQAMVDAGKFRKVRKIIAGGEQRHFSVWNGLQAVESRTEFIAIHDGARPLVTPDIIHDCLVLAKKEGAACLASPIPDTLKRADTDQLVTDSVERSGLWAMQTPQIFSRDLIFEAYAGVIAKNRLVTDEVSAVQGLGKKIALLRNEEWNFKITFPRDLDLAEQVLSLRRKKKKAGKA